MYRFLFILGLCFYFTPSKALHVATKPTLSCVQDSVGFPIYPLTLEEERQIKKDLHKAKKEANATLILIPLGVFMFGVGGILRIVFAIKSIISIDKIEKQIAHYPEEDELRVEFDTIKQKVYASAAITAGWFFLLLMIILLLISILNGGGGVGSLLIVLGAFSSVLVLLGLEFFVFKTNKIE